MSNRILCFAGSGLLVIMAVLHGSGTAYINAMVRVSDVPELIKQIFPVLFILPSLQLLGFAVLGILAAYMTKQAKGLLITLALLVAVDAGLALYLNAIAPALILLVPASIFAYVAFRSANSTVADTHGE